MLGHYLLIAFGSLLSGGALWEFIKFIHPIIKESSERKREAYAFLSQNIDPILKAADELYGKLVSLSDEDFAAFKTLSNSGSDEKSFDQNKKYTCYLFAQFWAQLEHIRIQSRYSSITRLKKGVHLLRFIHTFETRKFRVLDRSLQRMIGETMIAGSNGGFRVMSLNDFVRKLENKKPSGVNKLISHLEGELDRAYDKDTRQRILRYGIIVSSFVNHFDPEHKFTLKRKIYVNKLTPASKRILGNFLFRLYLPFVSTPKRYYGAN